MHTFLLPMNIPDYFEDNDDDVSGEKDDSLTWINLFNCNTESYFCTEIIHCRM